MGYKIQGAGCRWSARRVSDAASVRGVVRKHDCALPTLHPKHSNARGALIRAKVKVRVRVRVRVTGGLLATTSHSTFYSSVGQIAIFSHCQP